jgi:hypothetical protein
VRPRLFLTVVAAAICGALALTGIAGAGGGDRAKTKVTINEQNGDFSGKVKSPRLNKCADNRKVKLYKQRGPNQNPGREEVVATDTSELQGNHGEWSTGNSGLSGKFYARARKTPDCKADSSRTVRTP